MRFTPFFILFLLSTVLPAQPSALLTPAETEALWQQGNLPVLTARWAADSTATLAPARSPRTLSGYAPNYRGLIRRHLRLADAWQLLGRPDRAAYLRRVALLALTDTPGPPSSLEMEVRGLLVRAPLPDEATYNLVDTAAVHFGKGHYQHRRALRFTAMKAYNDGANERADSLMAAINTSPPKTPDERNEAAAYYRMLGVNASARNERTAALAYHRRAVRLAKRETAAYSAHVLDRLDLANAYRNVTRYDSAHAQLDSFARETARLQPDLLPLRGQLHLARGRLFRAEGRFREAARALETANRHFSAYPLNQGYRGDVMLTRSTMASVYNKRQDYHGAAQAYRSCIQMAEARRQPNSLQLLGLNLNYANVLGNKGDFETGYARAKEALRLARERLGEKHLYVAVALNTMAENASAMGRSEEAERLARQSLALREALYPPGHERLLYPRIVLAKLLTEAGRMTEAVALHDEIVVLCTSNNGAAAPACREYRIDRIQAYLDAGDTVLVHRLLQALNEDFPSERDGALAENPSLDVAQLQLNAAATTDAQSRAYRSAALTRYDAILAGYNAEAADILLAGRYGDLFRQAALAELDDRSETAVRNSWNYLARLKYNALWRTANARQRRAATLPDSLATAITEAATEVDKLMAQRRAAEKKVTADSLARLVVRTRAAQDTYEALQRTAKKRFPAYRRGGIPVRIDWTLLHNRLGETKALVDVLWTPDELLLYVAEGGKTRMLTVPLSEEAETEAQDFAEALATGDELPELPWLKAFAHLLQALSATELTVLLDGPLHRISLGSIPVGDQLLVNTKTIHYGWSIHDCLRQRPANVSNGTVYGVFPELAEADDLPASQAEAARLQQIVAMELEDGTAWAESNLPAGVWHFATHAFTDAARPDNSYLQLANQRLMLGDIQTQSAAVPLVVLGACETAVGRWEAGEGAHSLGRAFARAGAQSVLTTLWKVPDAAAAAILTEFYTGLRSGSTSAAALRQAQLAYLASVDDPRQRHPRNWAGFVLVGADETIALAGGTRRWWGWGAGVAALLFLLALGIKRSKKE